MVSDHRQYELEQIADKHLGVAVFLGFLLSPLGYVYIGRWGLAVINLFTLNYLLLGIVIVPIHVYRSITAARSELKHHEQRNKPDGGGG